MQPARAVVIGIGSLAASATGAERAHPGWNHVSTELTLTMNEPAYFSAYSGQPRGMAPFTTLDAGDPPGRPDPAGSTDRVLRGFLLAWAVDANNEEIRWNHLFGGATIVDYRDGTAWQYPSWSFPVVSGVAHGDPTGVAPAGRLDLDGSEYTACFSQLMFNFYAASPFAGAAPVRVETELTLHPTSVDLRQEDDGPVTTKARFQIWNENEVKFNGTERCITCWDQRLLSDYTALGIPNSFLAANLQTTMGKARLDGVRSQNCDIDVDPVDGPLGTHPGDVISADAAVLGVVAKLLGFVVPGGDDTMLAGRDVTALNLIGMGTEPATILYDVLGAPPESIGPVEAIRPDQLTGWGGPRADDEPVADPGPAPQSPTRLSASTKGSLLIFSRVELRWNELGELVQDTFVTLGNDDVADVNVQLYFVNGDPPLAAVP